MLLQHTLIGMLATLAAPVALAASPAFDENGLAPEVAPRSWQMIVLHHSATAGGSVASIDAVHRRKKDSAGNPWLGIGYHFVVGNGHAMEDGEVQPTFRWRQQLAGAHAGKHRENEQGIGICLIGNFNDAPPTEKQLTSLSSLLKSLSTRYAISPAQVLRHQDVNSTECPGRLFPWEQVIAGLTQGKGS